jgi:hypothetical protein
MSADRFWRLLMIATLVSIAVATWVAIEFHWLWGVVAYFVCAFLLDATLLWYSCKTFEPHNTTQ